MAGERVLIVDDELAMLENCSRLLSREGYECFTLSEPLGFRDRLKETQPEVVVLDLRMPEVDGMTLLTVALADDPTLPLIIMTAYATVSSAVQAIREGAFDYLTKPFRAEELLIAVERAIRHRRLTVENRALRAQVSRDTREDTLIGASPAMVRLKERMAKAASAEANVLITGESGTGKELIAHRIHALSGRRNKSFVPVDCATLPEGLLESELFGHERGAFTSADVRKTGLLEEGDGGTVFLDEITELSPALQAKLLRVLEERQVRHLGGTKLIDVDIRLIAATNQDLEEAVAAGRFREDLFYRLNVVPIRVPPLRERDGDVILLGESFLAQFSARLGKEAPGVSPDVWDVLTRHDWPGNVRELKNLIERLVVLDEDGRIALADLPESLRPSLRLVGPPVVTVDQSYEAAREQALHAFKADYVQQMLQANDGNITRAARRAGVSRRTFHRWLTELESAGGGKG